jgi:broad specificity phosphatase PhoE
MPDSETMKADSDPESAFAAAPDLHDDATIWLIRHGETEWSRTGRHTGTTDIPLTAAGDAQAEALRPLLAGLHAALVLCSPRRRALDTARLAGLTVDDVDDDLAEWDYGDYEGRTAAEIRVERPGWTLWTGGVPHGETAEQVGARADRVLQRARAHLDEGPVVLVAHGHISRVIGARWIGLPVTAGARLALSTAAPSVLGAQYGVSVIDRWNIPNPADGNGGSR